MSVWLPSLLILCLAALAALNGTALPDQIWLSGIYDDADDDAAILLADTTAVGPRPPLSIKPARDVLSAVRKFSASLRVHTPVVGVHPRSPPIS